MTSSTSSYKLVIIAGEVSGDIHGSRLVGALKSIDPGIQIEGIGGELMIEKGFKNVKKQITRRRTKFVSGN